MEALTPLPPGQYGVRVVRGPSFEESRYGNLVGGQDVMGMGTVLVPSARDLQTWAANLLMHGETIEGFTPWRSCRVLWDNAVNDESLYVGITPNKVFDDVGGFYYKAGDMRRWDIATDLSWKIIPPHVVSLETTRGCAADPHFLPRSRANSEHAQAATFKKVCDDFVGCLKMINDAEYNGSIDIDAIVRGEIENMESNACYQRAHPLVPRVVWGMWS